MRNEGVTLWRRGPARTVIIAGLGVLVTLLVEHMLFPSYDDLRWSHVSRPVVVNQGARPVHIFAIDAAGQRVRTARLAPRESKKILLAGAILAEEFHTRTIQILVTDESGIEIGRADFPGTAGEYLDRVVVGDSLTFTWKDRGTSLQKATP